MSRWEAMVRLAPVYGLPLLAIALVILFSLLLPTTFPTLFNLRSILSDKSIVALLALSALLPMIAGRIDLTIGTASYCGTSSRSACRPRPVFRGN